MYNDCQSESNQEPPQSERDQQSSYHLNNLAPQLPPNVLPDSQSISIPFLHPRVSQPEGRQRLIIDKIVLENFKSYAGKQVIGPFHENFTSVVGPNGSGKSNLIESMLFIFGYKANWMRLNRLNQLIHNSSTVSGIEKAVVEVQFKKIEHNENDDIREVPGSFSLKRIVKSSGVSKYYINDRQSSQGEVQDRLKQEGIDLNNNRFLILQGEVEQISQMKQKSGDRDKPGLLEYLEDIIGSNIYIEQIESGIQEYNIIEETKHEKGELMKLAEVELKNMSKGKDEAVRYVKKQRQIYQIHNIMQQVIIYQKTQQAQQLKQRAKKAEAERSRIIQEQKQKLKKQAERIKEIKKNKQEIQNMEKQLTKQNQIMGKQTIADKHINQEIQFKSEDLAKYNKKLKQFDRQLGSIINESDQLNKEMPEQKGKLQALEKNINSMEKQLVKYDKPELKKKVKQLENHLKKINHEITTFEDKKKLLQKNIDHKFKKAENLELRKLEAERTLMEQTESFNKIMKAEPAARQVKNTLSRELEDLSMRRKKVVAELENVEINLKESRSQTQEIGMFNNMFEKIMHQSIPGVIGRLGDLGSIPRQYDEIITTCCSRLDNIVVQNLDAANAVLNFLKTSKLGRVTCIILDKIQDFAKQMNKPWTNQPNSIRLFDVIKPINDQVKIAFYFAISDTIYCENSQLGMEYSLKDDRNRRRVISKKPNGYIIYELNGLMNGCIARRGGFDPKAKSKLKNSTESSQIKTLQKLRTELNSEMKKIELRFKQLKSDHDGVASDLQQIWQQQKKIENKISQAKEELHEIQSFQSKNKKSENQNQRKNELQIEGIKQRLEQLIKEKNQIQNQVKSIEKQQRKNQSQKINELRDDYKISKQEYAILEKSIQKKIAILETTLKRVNENKKNKEDLSKKKEKLEKEVEKLIKQRKQVEIKATQTLARIAACEDRIDKCRKIEEELKSLFEGEEKQVRESKLRIDKAKEEVQLCQNHIKVFTDQIEKAEEELKKQRETYKQLSSSYDFLAELQNIESMSIETIKRNSDVNKSFDSSILLNQSIDLSNTSMSKIFPIDKLLNTSPFQDLSEDDLNPFLLFTKIMRTMLITEGQNLKKMSGNNLQIIAEYRTKFYDFKKKHEQFEEVKRAQIQLKKKIQQLKEKRLQTFREGFSLINTKLKEVYQLLTKGGDAELELIDSLDPFSDGINFSVRPPKKAWKEINKLSGGQKTLSSLSLIFALHYYKPTPLYFMDEIDAALDFKNVSIVADYIKKRTKNAQFIIISLRNNMFELADKLVGVYKTYDKTKIVHFVPSHLRRMPRQGEEKENLDSNENNN